MTQMAPKPIFISDLHKHREGNLVVVIGQVIAQRKFKSKVSLHIKDFTKTCIVEVSLSCTVRKGMRVRVTGQVAFNQDGSPIVNNVVDIKVLGNFSDFEAQLNARIREQVSKMNLSKICDAASQFLASRNYMKFESDLLSKNWTEHGLEPLQVLFPGFGSPAGLITSPSAQVIEFLISTGFSRAYTLSKSFSTTLRYPTSRTEVLLIMAKATDYEHSHFQEYMWDLFRAIIGSLEIDGFETEYKIIKERVMIRSWFEGPPQISRNELSLLCFEEARSVNRDFWTGSVDSVLQIHLDDRGVLIEGSRELVGEEMQIHSLVVYPSQFLHFLKSTPQRSLENLGRFSVWR